MTASYSIIGWVSLTCAGGPRESFAHECLDFPASPGKLAGAFCRFHRLMDRGMRIRTLVGFGLLAIMGFGARAEDYASLKAQAEQFFSEHSYSKAHEVYVQAAPLAASVADKGWVEFRLADTQWRSQAATETADNTALEQAHHQLDLLVRDITRVEEHDRVWAEVQESLGDYFWIRRNQHNWGEAWPHYQQALDWWAGSSEIEVARDRYLAMIWRVAQPPSAEAYYRYGYWGNYLPADFLENALKIARAD